MSSIPQSLIGRSYMSRTLAKKSLNSLFCLFHRLTQPLRLHIVMRCCFCAQQNKVKLSWAAKCEWKKNVEKIPSRTLHRKWSQLFYASKFSNQSESEGYGAWIEFGVCWIGTHEIHITRRREWRKNNWSKSFVAPNKSESRECRELR